MTTLDITNINELNLEDGIFVLEGQTNSLKIKLGANKHSKIVLLNTKIDQLTINLEEDSTLEADMLRFSSINLAEEFSLAKGASLKYKVISSYEYNDNLTVNLNGQYANFDGNYLVITKGFKSVSKALVNHNDRNTLSNISNFGISLEQSEILFDTTGRIEKGMAKSTCEQLSRGIIFGNKAAIISKPVLLIDEYDIKANHGAAIGKMSDDELFYLMSRGLSHDEAFKLILSGIVNPFLDNLILDVYKNKVEESIYNLLKR